MLNSFERLSAMEVKLVLQILDYELVCMSPFETYWNHLSQVLKKGLKIGALINLIHIVAYHCCSKNSISWTVLYID